MTSHLPNRRATETHSIVLPPGHKLHVSISRDDAGGIIEVFFVGRGKSGAELDAMFAELGVQLSRIVQWRDPETGEPIGAAR